MQMRLTLLLLGVLPWASALGQSVQLRFEEALRQVKSLSAVEVEWLDTLWIRDPDALRAMNVNKPVFCRTFRYFYAASGPKYRASCRLVSGTETNLVNEEESAFDGAVFFSYRGDSRYMTKSHEKLRGSEGQSPYNPMLAPFMFLTRQSDDCLNCVLGLTEVASDEFAKGLTLSPGQKSVGMIEISWAGLPLAKQQTTWRIALDDTSASFTPKAITMIAPGGRVQIVSRLINYTNLGEYQFPSRIEWIGSAYPATSPPTLLSTGTVTLVSARLRGQLADSVFRLEDEERSAATVWDWDKKTFEKSVHDTSDSTTNQARPRIYDESADGSKQIKDALQRAKQEHKHVLLQFGANWCSPCHKLHQLFETNQDIAAELRAGYVVAMIDVNKGHNMDVDAKYGHPIRFGLPAIVVLDTEGKQLTTQNTAELEQGGRHSAEKVTAFLKKWSPAE